MSLFLALEADGATAEALSPQRIREFVRTAERAGVTLVTFTDSPLPPARLESVGRAAFVATATNTIGLAPAISPRITEPFHVAAQLASLDHASHGRAAWLVAPAGDAALATVGADPGVDDSADAVEVARRLWDSWEDDAVIKDVSAGRYLDPDKVHHVDFEGATFSVKGPLITPRPPQGQVVVIAPDALDVDADIVLIDDPGRAAHVRGSGKLVFANVHVDLGGTTARQLTASLREFEDIVDGVRLHASGTDLPVLIDEVLPELDVPAPKETLRATLGLARPANRFAVRS